MVNQLIRLSAVCASAAIIVLTTAQAFAQQPTDAQRNAIRSDCRSDYEAHCASVPPGGMASLQCLQKNMSSLSPSCQRAVSAVAAPAEPQAKPAATTAAPAAAPATTSPSPAKPTAAASPSPSSTATKQSTSAQASAIRSACRADYQKSCASIPPGGAAALNCLEKNKATLSPACQQAVSAVSGSAPAAAATTTTAPAAAPAAAPVLVLRPLRPREEIFVLRSACGGDVRSLCGAVSPGGGRVAKCLASQAASLSPACKEVLASFAAR